MFKFLSDSLSKLTNNSIKVRALNTKTMAIKHEVDTPFKKATFGMGCFWSGDCIFGAVQGVLRTRVGYSGGTKTNVAYKNIGDHTEVIEVDYDPTAVTYKDLLNIFFTNHEYGLTTKLKRQYMSLILYHDEDQKRLAEETKSEEEKKHKTKYVTEIRPAGPFYPAEDYHQKFRLQRHPYLVHALGLNKRLLQTSQVAAKLNGYVVGLGTLEQLETELPKFGLDEKVISYVRKLFLENKGGSLSCGY